LVTADSTSCSEMFCNLPRVQEPAAADRVTKCTHRSTCQCETTQGISLLLCIWARHQHKKVFLCVFKNNFKKI